MHDDTSDSGQSDQGSLITHHKTLVVAVFSGIVHPPFVGTQDPFKKQRLPTSSESTMKTHSKGPATMSKRVTF